MDRWQAIKSFSLDTNTEEGVPTSAIYTLFGGKTASTSNLMSDVAGINLMKLQTQQMSQIAHTIFKHTQCFVSSDEETSPGRFYWAANARENLPGPEMEPSEW